MSGCGGCTSCCEVIGIDKISKTKETDLKGSGSMPKGWKRLSRIQAKKKKPYLFSSGKWGCDKTYFECSHLTDKGCSIHKESPYVCSGYPYYGSERVKLTSYDKHEYNKDGCNLYKEFEEIGDTEHDYNKWVGLNFSNFISNHPRNVHNGWDNKYLNLIETLDIT